MSVMVKQNHSLNGLSEPGRLTIVSKVLLFTKEQPPESMNSSESQDSVMEFTPPAALSSTCSHPPKSIVVPAGPWRPSGPRSPSSPRSPLKPCAPCEPRGPAGPRGP